MDPQQEAPQSQRHKCSACYKQYKKKEHLIEHMKLSYHSVHDPKCGVCDKHCKSLESVREHVTGPLAKSSCVDVFTSNGCELCLKIFDSPDALSVHKKSCCLDPALPPELITMPIIYEYAQSEMETSCLFEESNDSQSPEVVAMDCELVGGGSDGSLDICARVCLIDESENVIFHSYVKPLIPVTNYRYELTAITENHLSHANPLMQVKDKIHEILYNGESLWRARIEGGKARILVGHSLDHDLDCLHMNYPHHLIRDTAGYPPLMKTNLVSHSLKYLAKTYLGYEIQIDKHNPYEDCVAALRLYKRMRSQLHQTENLPLTDGSNEISDANNTTVFSSMRLKELEKMSPDALLDMSVPKYRCWCLDAR